MTRPVPDARLRAAADFVRPGACLADIGCDHAILPVWLCLTGRISRAYACDIAEGPCARARETIAQAGLEKDITVLCTDGLRGLEGRGVTDISVCGMGGELIAEILSAADFLRDPALRLILIPMSKPAALRRFLAENGFAVTDETISEAAGKRYFCLCAAYDGKARTLSPFEAEFGCVLPRQTPPSPLFLQCLEEKKRALTRRRDGLEVSGRSHAEEDALLSEIGRYLHDRT